MTSIFLKFVNMSIAASWLVLAVVMLRLLLKKAPKWSNMVLWGIVGLRLLVPFSIESAFSLIPSPKPFRPEMMYAQNPIIHSGIPAVDNLVNPVLTDSFSPDPAASATPLQILIPIAAVIWMIGIALLFLYAAISCFRLHKRMKTAVLLRNPIYQSEHVTSPFVLGLLHPRIYLPFQMTDKDMFYVIAHEQAHIKRLDHWIKPLGFLLLSLYWFNPVIWVAYILFCKDIELACDERVIKELGNTQRADYTQALLTCSVPRRVITVCPLAFGETSVKERIKHVLNYKKPALWIVVAALLSCAVTAVCFLTSPKDQAAQQPDNPSVRQTLHTEEPFTADSVDKQQYAQKDTPVSEAANPAVSDLLDRICSSPGISSNPSDYIEAHPEEYQALLNNRDSTLHYCIAEFMKGNQTDLRGHIMALVCEELLQSKDEPLFDAASASTGQEWFDTILAHGTNIIEPYLSPSDHASVFGE